MATESNDFLFLNEGACIICGTIDCTSLQCIASHNTLWMKTICWVASNSGSSSKQGLFICLQHTWSIWKTSDEVHSRWKNVLGIMTGSAAVFWCGRMEKAIVTTQRTVDLPLVWLVQGSGIILKWLSSFGCNFVGLFNKLANNKFRI